MKRDGGAGASGGGTMPRRRGRAGRTSNDVAGGRDAPDERGERGDGSSTPSQQSPDQVDEAGIQSFPASDAPPWTPRVSLGAPHRHEVAAGPAPHRPSIERPLAGESLLFHLRDELQATDSHDILARSGRTARTLIKDDSLRVTVHLLAPGGHIPEHHADGPITVQVLSGALEFRAGDRNYDLGEGDLLALDAGIRHSLSSREGAAFLLTVSLAGVAGRH